MKFTDRTLPALLFSITTFFCLCAVGLADAQGTTTWIGVPNTSVTTNWSDTANWSPGSGASNPPGTGDTVTFGPNGSGGAAGAIVDNVVDTSMTIASLAYINTTAANGHNTFLLNNLTVNGLVTVGVASDTVSDIMSGSGNFTVNNTNGGSFSVGGNGISTATTTFTLANGTNTINVTTFSLGESASNNGRQCTLNLGNGVNIINADNLNAGTGKGLGTMQFPATSTNGSITIRNHTGTGRATILMGKGTSGSGSGNGKLLFAGNLANVLAGTVNMGGISGSDTGTPVATVTVDDGIFDATAILMGTSAGSSATHSSSGTLTMGGNPTNTATLIVNSPNGPGGGVLTLGNTANTVAQTGAGTLIINTNATAQIYCNIVKTNATQNTGTINIAGGTLIMEAATNTIGTPAVPIDNFTIDTATLQFSENGSSLNAAVGTLTMNDNLSPSNLVNIAALPPISALPTVIPIITYTSFGGSFNLALGTLPGGYGGYVTNDGVSTISLVITSGTVVAKADQWGGGVNNNWDTNTLNWTNASIAVKFADGDFVTFNDGGRTNNVNLTAARTPASLTVTNNSLNYTFSGGGSIIGSSSLVKYGGASLTLAESGGDNFVGGIKVHGGTVVLDNANNGISGGLTNDSGTVVQIGNNDGNGVLPSGSVDDEGTLVFSRSNNLTVATAISGGGALIQNGSGNLALAGANAYTGNTTVGSGTLALSGSGSIVSPLTFVQNAGLDISGSGGSVTLNALALTNGTLNVSNVSASVSTFSISNSTINLVANIGGSPNITATSLATGGTTNTINITSILNLPDPPTLPIIVPLVSYTSATFGSGFNLGLISPAGIGGYVSNDVANSSIDLVITLTPQTITWNGGSATDNNWSDAANWNGTAINALDPLIFDGTARLNNTNDMAADTIYTNITFNTSAFTLNGNPINFEGTMFNNTSSTQMVNLGFALNGSCTLDGGTSGGELVFNGGVTNVSGSTEIVTLLDTGTLNDLWATNSDASGGGQLEFQMGAAGGDWTILDGTGAGTLVSVGNLQLAMDVGAATGEIDFGSTNSAPNSAPNVDGGSGSVTVAGAGTSSIQTFNLNSGTLRVNTMTIPNNGNNFFNVNGGTLILGSGSFNGGGGNGAAVYVATVNSGAIYSTNGGTFHIAQRGPSTFIINGGLVQCGTLDISSGTAATGTGTNYLDGGTLICSNITCGLSAGNGSATMYFNGGTLRANSSSATFFSQNNLVPMTLIVSTNGAIIDTTNFSDTITFPLIHDLNLDVVQPAPDGGLTKLGVGTLTLTGANAYTGITTVSNGTLLVAGSLAGDATVAAAGTLAGTGIVAGQVTVSGTLAPGSAAVIGTLTVSSNVILNAAGTNVMKLNKTAATSDLLVVSNELVYGGTLSLNNLSGTLVASNTFQLFSAGTYSGAFANIVPATPEIGLAWNTNTLTTDGTLRMVSTVVPIPRIVSFHLTGSSLSISGTNGTASGGYTLLTSTNVAKPLSQWTVLATTNFDGSGNFSFTTNINTSLPQQFYIISQ